VLNIQLFSLIFKMADGGEGRLRSLGGNLKEEFKKSD
jgi:hypothetical protein